MIWCMDFAFRRCVEANDKIGVIDSQWIVHQGVPSLGNQGIPEAAKLPPAAGASPVLGVQAVNSRAQLPQAAQPAAVPVNLEFLCNSSQLQTLQAMVQANPQILQPVLQELKKNNSQMVRLIQDHQGGFIRLLNEPVEGGNPLDLFPQGLPDVEASTPGNLFLRNSPQFQALRTMVQANPQILEPMLEEIGKQNPQSARLIQDFIELINESVEGAESESALGDLGAAMPQAVTVTPEECEAIERVMDRDDSRGRDHDYGGGAWGGGGDSGSDRYNGDHSGPYD